MYGKKDLSGSRRHAWEILYRHYLNSGYSHEEAKTLAWKFISDER